MFFPTHTTAVKSRTQNVNSPAIGQSNPIIGCIGLDVITYIHFGFEKSRLSNCNIIETDAFQTIQIQTAVTLRTDT